jgi:hypothetical protein
LTAAYTAKTNTPVLLVKPYRKSLIYIELRLYAVKPERHAYGLMLGFGVGTATMLAYVLPCRCVLSLGFGALRLLGWRQERVLRVILAVALEANQLQPLQLLMPSALGVAQVMHMSALCNLALLADPVRPLPD